MCITKREREQKKNPLERQVRQVVAITYISSLQHGVLLLELTTAAKFLHSLSLSTIRSYISGVEASHRLLPRESFAAAKAQRPRLFHYAALITPRCSSAAENSTRPFANSAALI